MASGDASRTWFSEMIETLRHEWNSEMSWEQVFTLRDRLDAMLEEIRTSRTSASSMWCPVARGLGRRRRGSRFERSYSRLAVSALSPRRKLSHWRSAGQSTARKTADRPASSPAVHSFLPQAGSSVARPTLRSHLTFWRPHPSVKLRRRVGG
jgi:hypothetical protein